MANNSNYNKNFILNLYKRHQIKHPKATKQLYDFRNRLLMFARMEDFLIKEGYID